MEEEWWEETLQPFLRPEDERDAKEEKEVNHYETLKKSFTNHCTLKVDLIGHSDAEEAAEQALAHFCRRVQKPPAVRVKETPSQVRSHLSRHRRRTRILPRRAGVLQVSQTLRTLRCEGPS